jgi:hypothetical protein
MTDWDVQDLRATWFKESTLGKDAGDLFKAAFGGEPDSLYRNRVPSAAQPFLSRAYREDRSTVLSVTVAPGRIDLEAKGADRGPESLPKVNPNVAKIDSIAGYARVLSSVVGESLRTALAARLQRAVASQSAGATFILEQIAHEAPFDDAIETSFQVNRPLAFVGFENRVMNRLARFDTVTSRLFEVTGQRTVVDLNKTPPVREEYLVSLTLDFSSQPNGVDISPTDQETMFSQMLEEINKVITLGVMKAYL